MDDGRKKKSLVSLPPSTCFLTPHRLSGGRALRLVAEGMAEEILVGAVSDLPRGQRLLVKAADGRNIAVINAKGSYFAVDNACYHHGGPLLNGDIEELGGHPCIVCPWHSYKIALDTGEGMYYGLDIPDGGGAPRQCVKSKGVKQRVHHVVVRGGNLYCVVNAESADIESDRYALMPLANREAPSLKATGSGGPKIHSGFALGSLPEGGPPPSGMLMRAPTGWKYPPPASAQLPVKCVKQFPGSADGVVACFVFDKASPFAQQVILHAGMWVKLRIPSTPVAGGGSTQPLSGGSSNHATVERQWTITQVRGGCGGWFTITVKRHPGGIGSNWLHSGAALGIALEATFGGDFTLTNIRPTLASGRLLMVSAGIGITPMFAALKSIADDELAVDIGPALHIRHLHSCRDALRETPYLDDFFRWNRRYGEKSVAVDPFSYEIQLFSSQATTPPTTATIAQDDRVIRGRITPSHLLAAYDHLSDHGAVAVAVMLCGPTSFMDEVRRCLTAERLVAHTSIFSEDF